MREIGYEKSLKGSLHLLTEERIENDKRNLKWKERNEQPKLANTGEKGKEYGCESVGGV